MHTNFTVTMLLWPGEYTVKSLLNIEAYLFKPGLYSTVPELFFVRSPQ